VGRIYRHFPWLHRCRYAPGSTPTRFGKLDDVMRATLTDRSLAFARGKGVVRGRVWLFGRSGDGTLVGLRSISTET
jgi:hypothetical protein